MIFNSVTFLIFFTTFFLLYWLLANRNIKLQNILLLIGSYIFYGWADWRFLSLIIAVSLINFYLGRSIEKSSNPKIRQLLLYIGLIQGIGGLVFYKYYNFFVTSINDSFQILSIHINLQTLNLIVPIGISFFTFRTISYLLDISKGKIVAAKDWLVFFNYVSFFPSLLAGPIDKAKLLVPQLEQKRAFDYIKSVDGLRQILWGLFKKVAIADYCAPITDNIFENYQTLHGSTLVLGAFLYTFQIYTDFSGYSDMAIGFARLLGFNITKNFAFPLFSQNIAEFWRKWHISLTSWLTEYVFTPLSITFRDLGKFGLILAIVINFTIIGIWHGPNWTYILFGFLHGCYYIPLILKGTMNKKKVIAKDKLLPNLNELNNMLMTFTLVMFTFILFRSNSIGNAFSYYSKIFNWSLFTLPEVSAVTGILLIIILVSIEWIGRDRNYAIENLFNIKRKAYRWSFYLILSLLIFLFQGKQQAFIYFQF
jgi:D-alanyl-lipoteichoic acid acyltransferase DltB (MBOAT superfamily)